MTRGRAACLAIALAACNAPPPPPLQVAVRVHGDPGAPIANAVVQYGGQTIAKTDANGAAKLTLRGNEGESFDVTVACPPGFQSPQQAISIVLRRLADPGKTPEYDVACPPTTRALVVAVRADKGRGVPVVYLGREIGRTDASGAATVLLRVPPHETFDLTLATTDRSAEQLGPQNPVATFTAADRDDVFVVRPALHRRGEEDGVARAAQGAGADSLGSRPRTAGSRPVDGAGPVFLDAPAHHR